MMTVIDTTGLYFDPSETSRPDQLALDWLNGKGIPALAQSRPVCIHAGRATFCDGRYTPNPIAEPVFILPIITGGEIIDLCAWNPLAGELGTRLGAGAVIGQEQIEQGFGSTRTPLPVWRSPLRWLKASRRGIVVVDDDAARHLLAGLVLETDDPDFAKDLRQRLALPPPLIIAKAVRSAA